MATGTLDQMAKSPDSEKFAEKAGLFLKKYSIHAEDLIPIPQGAKTIRLKGGEALFFSAQPQNQGYAPIPAGMTQVQFPEYRKHFGYIDYGAPIFY
jgi:hypothetical protein